MDLCIVLIVLTVISCGLSSVNSLQNNLHHPTQSSLHASGTSREYCLRTTSDSFEASCLKNEVILMKSAVYGRMRVGRCLQAEGMDMLDANRNDPRFLGCSVDVLRVFDGKCSGRNHCVVRGMDDELERAYTRCYAALKSYLEADYECVVVTEHDRSCTVTLATSPVHLTPSSGTAVGCGTRSQPWGIEAPSGQNINVSIIDFELDFERKESAIPNHACEQLGNIFETTETNRNVTICRAASERERFQFTSQTNVVNIVLKPRRIEDVLYTRRAGEELDKSPGYLIRLSAVGCPNLLTPDDTWVRRAHTEAVVGCYSSRQTWHLSCVDNKWTGVTGNCTSDVPKVFSNLSTDSQISDFFQNYEVILIVGVAFLGLVVCLLVVCIGVVCWKRYTARYVKYIYQVQQNSQVMQGENVQLKTFRVLAPSQSLINITTARDV